MAGRGWSTTTLGEIAFGENGLVDGPFGSNLPASAYIENGVPVIRGSNLSLGIARFDSNEFVYVSDETANKLSRSLCKPGDIVFTKKGTIGQTGIIPHQDTFKRFLLSSNQMKLTVDPTSANPLFIYYAVSSRKNREKIIRDASVTGVPKINVAYLRTFPVDLPPLSEQRAIAHILGTLDDKIELNRRMNETLEEMARTIFKSWFVDFDPVRTKAEGRDPGLPKHIADLFPDHFEDSELGEIPAGWNVMPIGEAVRVVGGGTPSTREPAFWEGGVHCWATPKDLSKLQAPILLDTERKVSDVGLAKISSGLLPVGTILLSSRAPVGYLSVSHVPVSINQGFIAMICDRFVFRLMPPCLCE